MLGCVLNVQDLLRVQWLIKGRDLLGCGEAKSFLVAMRSPPTGIHAKIL